MFPSAITHVDDLQTSPPSLRYSAAQTSAELSATRHHGSENGIKSYTASEMGGKTSLAEVPIPFPACSIAGDWKTLCNI